MTPPVIWTKIYGHSLNIHSCGPVILLLLRVRNDCRFLFTKLCLYSKGSIRILRTNWGKPSWFEFPSLEGLSISTNIFCLSGLGKHILIFGFWDPFLSFTPISYTSMLPIKPNQLPSSAVLQKRMKMRKQWWEHSSLPCRILEITNRQQSVACVSVSEYVGDVLSLMMQRNGLTSRLW